MSTENKKILVIGGGIAGLTSAWELSRSGFSVELVEKTCFLGGHGIQFGCKATDECVQCGACSVEEMLKRVVEDPNITIHLATEVEALTNSGKFDVRLKKSSAADIHSESGLLKGYSKNNAPLYVVTGSGRPDQVPAGAVSLDDMGTSGSLEVDAVILASGFKPFNAELKSTYGYGRFKNVITGMDLEGIKRKNSRVVRPSDGKVPEKIAFIQCVGSRDERLGNLWCSQVCCPYAMRMATDVKWNNKDANITIFYMDIQNTGKSFPSFYKKCRAEMNFVRTIPVDVFPLPDERLKMRYLDEENGKPVEEEFDLIVLSVGITPGPDNEDLSAMLGTELNEDGFVAGVDTLSRTNTAAPGVFLAGTVEGPKTIAASIAHAGHAAREVMKYLGVNK